MRSNVDSQKIEQLMEALGKEARSSGCIYFTGGASALLIGWRMCLEVESRTLSNILKIKGRRKDNDFQ